MQFKFKEQNPNTQKRKEECEKVLKKYPDRIPIVIEKDPKTQIKEIDRTKFLVPNDLTIQHLIYIIRKKLDLSKDTSLFMLVNGNKSVTGEAGLQETYEKYKDREDGYLYILYTSELTWG